MWPSWETPVSMMSTRVRPWWGSKIATVSASLSFSQLGLLKEEKPIAWQIQRSVYKDLVRLLQNDAYLTENQLRKKGEMTFANDTLVEGGSLSVMHNGVTYREVRQYRTGHHLVRFYFLTRAYSEYVESVMADFNAGPKPDVVIISSCIWDLIRYTHQPLEVYKKNLDCLFSRLSEVLSPECLVIWNMTMPVGFKASEMPQHTRYNLRWDIVEGNFYSATLADLHKMDVLDMHYHFRFDLRFRCKDAVHWNQLAHRKYSQILLAHIAQAWGVEPPEGTKSISDLIKSGLIEMGLIESDLSLVVPLRNVPHPWQPFNDQENGQHDFGFANPNGPLPVVRFGNVPHPHPKYNDQENGQENGQHYFGFANRNGPLPVVHFGNVPHPYPKYNDQENGQHYFGPPIQNDPPHGVLLRNVPHPHPPCLQGNGQPCFEPMYLPGYTAFDGGFIPVPVRCPPNQQNSNAGSPFVDDDPFFINDFPPGDVDFDDFGIITVPGNHPFRGMSMPGEFSPFNYNSPMPRGAWRGRKMHRRREGYPYRKPLPYSSRI